MDRDAFDAIMTSLDTPMAVVTTAAAGERAGCLVGFHTQSSIEPRRYNVWLSKANHTYRVGLRATHLGVHLLTAGDTALAERFGTLSGDDTDKFVGLAVTTGPGDVPLLDGLPHLVVRRTVLVDEGGDHVCVAAEPIKAATPGPFMPLRLSAVAHLSPGHEAGEAPAPATPPPAERRR